MAHEHEHRTGVDRAEEELRARAGKLDLPWQESMTQLSPPVVQLLKAAGLYTLRDVGEAAVTGCLFQVKHWTISMRVSVWRALRPWFAWLGPPRATLEGPRPDWYDIPWRDALPDLDVRARNVLTNAGIETVGHAYDAASSSWLLTRSNCSKVTVRQIVEVVREIDRVGPEVARWGVSGKPQSMDDLVQRALALMSPAGRRVVIGAVLEGRDATELAYELRVSRSRIQGHVQREVRRAATVLKDIAEKLVEPIVHALEESGGALRGLDVEAAAGGEPLGHVLLALLVAGEKRYRIQDGNLTRLTENEMLRRLPPQRPAWTSRSRRTRAVEPPPPPDWSSWSWRDLMPDLSHGAVAALDAAGIEAFEDACEAIRSGWLLKMRGCGSITLRELKRALDTVYARGPEVSRWGPGGRPGTIRALVTSALYFMAPEWKHVVEGHVLRGRSLEALAADHRVTRDSIWRVVEKQVARASPRLCTVAGELVSDVVARLASAGGSLAASDVEQMSGASLGDVFLAALVAGERRLRVRDNHLIRLPSREAPK